MGVDPSVKKLELTHTSLLAREFDRFLFSDAEVNCGACLHQFPVHHEKLSPERSDFYISTLGHVMRPVAVSGYKTDNFDKAISESFGYSSRIHKNNFVVQLVLPASQNKIKLEVHVVLCYRIMVIDIWEVATAADEIKIFFKLLYAAVHFLINTPIRHGAAVCSPTQTLSLSQCLSPQGQVPRVFLKDGYVYKMFDVEVNFLNLDLVRTFLNNDAYVQVQYLSKDERFVVLQYEYIDGDHDIKDRKQAIPVLDQLIRIHSMNMVHSDIRKVNLVFCDDSITASFIDFDLADKVDTAYPENYNYLLKERHSNAVPGWPREKEHDFYSLWHVLQDSAFFEKSTLKKVKNGDLLGAKAELERFLVAL